MKQLRFPDLSGYGTAAYRAMLHMMNLCGERTDQADKWGTFRIFKFRRGAHHPVETHAVSTKEAVK